MATTSIQCQVPGCTYKAEHASEAVAIAMLTNHNSVHQAGAAQAVRHRVPKVDRPIIKQDSSDEEWQTFEADWKRFKRLMQIPDGDLADQLIECCEKPLSRLLLKENPHVIEDGEAALLAAMKKMAVLGVATTIKRTNLMAMKQEHGQTFREFNAHVRAIAATCAYSVRCPHQCCNTENAVKEAVDYTSLVVKDILISGIEDVDIRKDVLSMRDLDAKSDKDIVTFVEEKEIARNALQMSSNNAGISTYSKGQKKIPEKSDTSKKLALRAKCQKCSKEISPYKQYPSGKLNAEPFSLCVGCWKKAKPEKKQREKNKEEVPPTDSAGSGSANAIMSFISAVESNSERIEEQVPSCPSENVMHALQPSEVEISICTTAHHKLGRSTHIPFIKTVEIVQDSPVKECLIGLDILQKLSCHKSALLNGKTHVSQVSGYPSIGKVLLRIEAGGHFVNRVVHVVESISGLHLNSDTRSALRSLPIQDEACSAESQTLDHHIYTSTGWSKVSSLNHPRLRVRVTTDENDYAKMGFRQPIISPKYLDVVTDSGAQSCLWSRKEFLSSGFSMKDLIPVRHTMRAANCVSIEIDGAVLLRLSGPSSEGEHYEAAVMVYVSPDVRSFFLSKDAMVQLGVIAPTFPRIGSASVHTPQAAQLSSQEMDKHTELCNPEDNSTNVASCGCLRRRLPPGKPNELPFSPVPENIEKMKKWLLDNYGSSVFNQCPHQLLPEMDGPPISLHVSDDARPVKHNTPASIPLHWQEKVKEDLERDVRMGVLERVPYGETPDWVHRLVVVRKKDGGPRRTADMSPLNKFCVRETHPTKSPFHLARSVPGSSYKTVFDAWNGFHSVPIRQEDRHYTTFITPWGLFRYIRAPQGFLSSGDGYNRRLDDILAGLERLVRCVDDSLLFDDDNKLRKHWWRVIDFMEVAGNAGVVLNPEKFQFAQKTVDFAGFRINSDTVEPLPKYLDAIREYPTPVNITDIRSFFGLVNQVSHYAQLRDLMEPLRKFLSPKVKFEWNANLDEIFAKSKAQIVEAIKNGVQIFDPSRSTALMTDWSKTGIGFWLLQKHCICEGTSPSCCQDGWKITLAGSRFLSSAEMNYAPVEGEALAVAWSLEQTRFFTMGCDDLVVVVDHKPLVKLLGDRRLDEISNPRLFRIKQRTLMWNFKMKYQPGKANHVADAISRHPNKYAELASFDLQGDGDHAEAALVAGIGNDMDKFFAITWEMVQTESRNDQQLTTLAEQIALGFPAEKQHMPADIAEYWDVRNSLNVVKDVVLYNDRIVVPRSLRNRVIENLHSAHQGITSMTSRAMSTVFWPGITSSIEKARQTCRTCHKNAPSQPKLPPIAPKIPTTPFQMICSDYFKLGAYWYLVTVDRLSGWSEVAQIKAHSGSSGAKGLCQALRQLFATFGVPEEISSDGGPEFTAGESKDFYNRWGVKHRISSAYHPQSNGRAELAVKITKRLLENNTGPTGELNTDKVVCALLQQRNTPDRDCGLSPAEIIFGHPLRDGLPQISKSEVIHNNRDLRPEWREAWELKEDAIRSRLVKNCERLEAHSKELDPLREGDSVLIQNQIPSSPRSKKWDRQGTVIATGDNDQYLVKVEGSGRLTLRNRRFLRRFKAKPCDNLGFFRGLPTIDETSTTESAQSQKQPATPDADSEEGIRESNDLEFDEHSSPPQKNQNHGQHNILDPSTSQDELSEPTHTTDHAVRTPQKTAGRPRGPSRKTLRKQQLAHNLNKGRAAYQGDDSANTDEQDECHIGQKENTPSLRRSERVRTTRTLYDAHTGR
jgi:ribosomal protein L44E